VAVTHNGSYIFLCDDAGTVHVHTVRLAPRMKVAAHRDPCRAVTLSPQDLKFATGSDDTTIRVWDVADTKEPERTLLGGL
jgi:polyadenylation factor subunit 2